jgi:hypothetical protein
MLKDMSSSLEAAIAAASTGGNPMDAAFSDVPTGSGGEGRDSASINEASKFFDDEEAGTSSEGQDTDGQAAAESTQPAESPNVAEASNSSKGKDIERLKVTGPNGPEEVEIDFSNREELKRQISMAYGARKWQSERDSAQKKLKEIEPDYKDATETRDAIVGAFKQKGFKGLVNLLLQDEKGYDNLLEMEVQKRQAYTTATPELKAKMDAEARYEELLRQMQFKEEQTKLENDKLTKRQAQIAAEQQAVAEQSFTTMASTALQMNSFKGKLGDVELESRLDDSVWSNVRKALSQLPDDMDITQELLNSMVSKEVGLFNKGLGRKVEADVKQSVDKTKQASANKLATAAQQGMGKNGAADKFADSLSKGNTADAVRAFFGLKK